MDIGLNGNSRVEGLCNRPICMVILGPIRWPIKCFVTFSAYISSWTLHRSVQLDIIFNDLGKK